MSFLNSLSKDVGYLGRGLEDLFTLGGTEIARNNGGNFGNKFFNVLDKGFGSNFAAGAAGGLGYLGGSALGAGGAGSSGGAAGMGPVGSMSQAGSTLGGGMSSPLNLGPSAMGSTGAAPGASVASSPASMLQNMRQMPTGGGQQQQPTQKRKDQLLSMIYAKFPQLRPGSQIGGQNAIR